MALDTTKLAQPSVSSDLILGTAQLGLAYGVANRAGMPSEDDGIALVREALQSGIRGIDTARAYGDAERRIGLACPPGSPAVPIVTKLDPLEHIPPEVAPEIAVNAARASLEASRAALLRHRVDTLLLHRAQHRTTWGGAVWDMLRSERDAGGIGNLGVSVQTPSEALAALDDRDVRHVQLPFNLLDRRWADAGVIDALRNRSDIVVHVRSVLLQGLVDSPATRWPTIPGLDPSQIVDHLQRLAGAFNRRSIIDVAVAFVRAHNWIDGIVIGMETREQLVSNIALFTQPALTADETSYAQATMPRLPIALLDPANWPKESVMTALEGRS